MSQNDVNYVRKDFPDKLKKIGIFLFAVGVLLGIVAFLTDSTRVSFNYLITYTFLISIGVGSLFLVALEYVAGAVWSVPFRRVTEYLAGLIPLLFVLVIPLLFNMHDIFHWSHKEVVAQDEICHAY